MTMVVMMRTTRITMRGKTMRSMMRMRMLMMTMIMNHDGDDG